MNTSSIVQKLWNYCKGGGAGQSLARLPGREYAGTRSLPGSPSARLLAQGEWLTEQIVRKFQEFPVPPGPEERVKACIIGLSNRTGEQGL
jgi:hypothetical protein